MRTTHRMRARPQGLGGLSTGDNAFTSDKAHKRAVDFLDVEFERLKAEQRQHEQRSSFSKGIRAKMNDPDSVQFHTLSVIGHSIVSATIVANAVQFGLSLHFNGEPAEVWSICEHIVTGIFFLEMMAKLYAHRGMYFCDTWNILDFAIVSVSIVSMYLLPIVGVVTKLSTLQVLRLLRLMRLSRLLHVTTHMRLLVENLLYSLQSLGWILLLLLIISYIFSIICVNFLDKSVYDPEEFDPVYYFGDIQRAMLTFFNVCILAEWSEIIRPVFEKQPHLVIFLFLPYLMLCTFSVLNLIIGVIAERTLAASASMREYEGMRDKMKAIIRLTDQLYDGDSDGRLTRQEFIDTTTKHPDFMELMWKCEFPKGLHVEHLHMIFDEAGNGFVAKEDFINGMFRLVFNNLPQHVVTLQVNMAQLKQEVVGQVEHELLKLHELLEFRLGVAPEAMSVVREDKYRMEASSVNSLNSGCAASGRCLQKPPTAKGLQDGSSFWPGSPGRCLSQQSTSQLERPFEEMKAAMGKLECRLGDLLSNVVSEQAPPGWPPGSSLSASPEKSLMHALDLSIQEGPAAPAAPAAPWRQPLAGFAPAQHLQMPPQSRPAPPNESIWVQMPDCSNAEVPKVSPWCCTREETTFSMHNI